MDPIAGFPGDCRDTSEGDPPITGTFIANDSHFGYWTLSTLPNTTMTPSNQPKAPGLNNYQPAPAPSGHARKLATSGPSPADPLAFQMHPCGYVRTSTCLGSFLLTVPQAAITKMRPMSAFVFGRRK